MNIRRIQKVCIGCFIFVALLFNSGCQTANQTSENKELKHYGFVAKPEEEASFDIYDVLFCVADALARCH